MRPLAVDTRLPLGGRVLVGIQTLVVELRGLYDPVKSTVYDSPILICPDRILRLRDVKRLAQGRDLGTGGIWMRKA